MGALRGHVLMKVVAPGSFLFFLFFAAPPLLFAQSTSTALADIVKQIQDAIVRGASEAEIAELQKKLVSAQVSQSFEIKTTPEYPGPNEDVSIEIITYATDLKRAKITWLSGGKTLADGFGVTKQVIRTRGVGERISVTVTIKTYEGLSVTKNVSMTPADVVIHWEAATYTPPFYRGKALPTPKSEIKMVAFPDVVDVNKKEVSGNSLVYVWRSQNGTILDQGYGKLFAHIAAPDLVGIERPVDIEISTLSDSIHLKKRFYIKSFSPVVLLYEESPILGVLYSQSLKKDTPLAKEELTIKGEPFFFSRSLKNSLSLLYEWMQNGAGISSENNSRVTLRRGDGAVGSSKISLSIKNPSNIFDTASNSVLLRFTE